MISSILLIALGMWEVIAIVAVVLLLFGGRKIPELAKGLGKGLKEFKNATKEDDPSDAKSNSDNSSE